MSEELETDGSEEIPAGRHPTDPKPAETLPMTWDELQSYLELVNLLPDGVTDRVDRYRDPFTGERQQYRYDNHAVLAELHRVAHAVARREDEPIDAVSPPSKPDVEEHGRCTVELYRKRFDSFPRALEVAGFEPVFSDAQEKARYLGSRRELWDPEQEKD